MTFPVFFIRASTVFAALLIGVGCPGQEISATRCNDSRDCPSNAICADGVCEEIQPGPGTAEPAPRPDAGPFRIDGGIGPVDDAGQPDAGVDENDAGTTDGGPDVGPSDGGTEDGGAITDAGLPEEDAVVVSNDGATLSVSHEDLNIGQNIRITADILAGNFCDLTFNGGSLSLVAGRTEHIFLPSTDGSVQLACEGYDELSMTYRVFSVSLQVETDLVEAAPEQGIHLLRWASTHSQSCTLEILGGDVLFPDAGVAGDFRTTLSDGGVKVACDGVDGVPVEDTLTIDTSELLLGDMEVNADDGNISVSFTSSRIATCVFDLPSGQTVTQSLRDGFSLEVTVEDAIGDWTIECDSGDGAVVVDSLFVPEPPSIQYLKVSLDNSVLRLKWAADGECSLNENPVDDTGDIQPTGTGRVVFQLICRTLSGEVAQSENIHFGDIALDGTDDLDAVVGNVTVAPNTQGLPEIELIVGDFAVGILETTTALSVEVLRAVTGALTINTDLATLSFNALSRVGDSLAVDDSENLTALGLPGLTSVGGDFHVAFCPLLDAVSAAALLDVGANVDIADLPEADVINLRRLSSVSNINIETVVSLDTLELDAITEVDSIRIAQVNGLDTLQLDALVTAPTFFFSFAHEIATLQLPALSNVETFTLHHNHALIALDAPNLSNITDVNVRQNHAMTSEVAIAIGELGANAVTCPNQDDCPPAG